MSTALKDTQKAIYTVLNNDSQLKKLASGVFYDVPAEQPYPYITIGDVSTLQDALNGKSPIGHNHDTDYISKTLLDNYISEWGIKLTEGFHPWIIAGGLLLILIIFMLNTAAIIRQTKKI